MLNLDWSIIWNIVNILVLFLLLKIFLFKPITKMMESRTAEIENNLKLVDDTIREFYGWEKYKKTEEQS